MVMVSTMSKLEVYKKKVKIKIDQEQLITELFKAREEMNESIIQWCKGFYKLRDSIEYQVIFHLWKENKEEIYKKQMFDLLEKYHLAYQDYKAFILKSYPRYYEIFYSMNKKIYRRFVDALLNERSLGYFNEKVRKTKNLSLTPYNINGESNLLLDKGIIDFKTIQISLDIVDVILLEEYRQKAYVKGYTLNKEGILEIELILENDGNQFEVEYISKEIFQQRLF